MKKITNKIKEKIIKDVINDLRILRDYIDNCDNKEKENIPFNIFWKEFNNIISNLEEIINEDK